MIVIGKVLLDPDVWKLIIFSCAACVSWVYETTDTHRTEATSVTAGVPGSVTGLVTVL